jgi:NAD(P)-dependent dehydrogenase (short-subunit alcohol dehydrogenase family)
MTGGKVAFVTGGSRGIGQAIARALLRAGTRVAITATSDSTLQRAARELASEPNNAEVLPIRADVRYLPQVEQEPGC